MIKLRGSSAAGEKCTDEMVSFGGSLTIKSLFGLSVAVFRAPPEAAVPKLLLFPKAVDDPDPNGVPVPNVAAIFLVFGLSARYEGVRSARAQLEESTCVQVLTSATPASSSDVGARGVQCLTKVSSSASQARASITRQLLPSGTCVAFGTHAPNRFSVFWQAAQNEIMPGADWRLLLNYSVR